MEPNDTLLSSKVTRKTKNGSRRGHIPQWQSPTARDTDASTLSSVTCTILWKIFRNRTHSLPAASRLYLHHHPGRVFYSVRVRYS